MIEVTIEEIEGVKFLKNIRILQPDNIVNSVSIHWVDRYKGDEEFIRAIGAMGLRKVGYDYPRHKELYASFPMNYVKFKVISFILRGYWVTIRWLYDNARFFKRIPDRERFSWRYFTPYVWCRQLRRVK